MSPLFASGTTTKTKLGKFSCTNVLEFDSPIAQNFCSTISIPFRYQNDTVSSILVLKSIENVFFRYLLVYNTQLNRYFSCLFCSSNEVLLLRSRSSFHVELCKEGERVLGGQGDLERVPTPFFI